jgi:hypothetical protein
MSEFRLHQISLSAGAPEFRMHQITLTAEQVPVDSEFRMHSIALTSSSVPPISDGGWMVMIDGELVEHEALYWVGGQWV